MACIKKTRCKFWMVYVDGMGSTKAQHFVEEEARREAGRLARQTGRDVFLLEASEYVRALPPEPPVSWRSTVRSEY